MSWQRSSRHTFPSHITGVKDARGLQVLSVGYNAMGRVETLSDLYVPGKRDRIWVKEYLPLRSHPYWRPTTLPGVKRATACLEDRSYDTFVTLPTPTPQHARQ